MNYRKHGLKALGLSFLAVLGLMAFAAGGAQASGLVKILKNDGSGNLLPTPWTSTITGEGLKLLEKKLLILGLNMEIFCHTAVATGSINENGSGSASIVFDQCLAQGVSGGALSGAVCEIEDITATANALVILHSGNGALTLAQHGTGTGSPYLLFTPEGGITGTFATVINETECALPEEAKVKGCVVAAFETSGHQKTHKISTLNMLQLFGCHLLYGANEAHLDALADIELGAPHTGFLWGVE